MIESFTPKRVNNNNNDDDDNINHQICSKDIENITYITILYVAYIYIFVKGSLVANFRYTKFAKPDRNSSPSSSSRSSSSRSSSSPSSSSPSSSSPSSSSPSSSSRSTSSSSSSHVSLRVTFRGRRSIW